MFLCERQIPIEVQKCEALLRNISANHHRIPEIQTLIRKKMSGYYGEKSLDYHLGSLNQDFYDIIPGIRLSNSGRNFQIDTLILTNYFMLIIEIKYLRGELEIDSAKGQLIQHIDGKINVYDDPFAQVNQQKFQLMKWMESQKFPPIPIETLVVLSNNNALIKKVTGSSNNYWRLCRCINAHEKILHFENMYKTEYVSFKTRRKLGKILLKHNTPQPFNVLSRFNIPPSDLLPGIQCPKCTYSPMIYTYGKWNCQSCGYISKDAHHQKINDYFQLFGPTITNRQFRELVCLSSRHQATRILNSMNLHHHGTNKGRVYSPLPEK
ncbi:nuclease-related domain-containing protein [Bacillus marasmi]|uniref:nuclease-related domain-containing protein n=1 Tax=Bacillus marasmi TaxID=1926279 RepID=UPI0011CAB367|nr:nuclease-related domain-containing protein [Bacillus marasmi]